MRISKVGVRSPRPPTAQVARQRASTLRHLCRAWRPNGHDCCSAPRWGHRCTTCQTHTMCPASPRPWTCECRGPGGARSIFKRIFASILHFHCYGEQGLSMGGSLFALASAPMTVHTCCVAAGGVVAAIRNGLKACGSEIGTKLLLLLQDEHHDLRLCRHMGQYNRYELYLSGVQYEHMLLQRKVHAHKPRWHVKMLAALVQLSTTPWMQKQFGFGFLFVAVLQVCLRRSKDPRARNLWGPISSPGSRLAPIPRRS